MARIAVAALASGAAALRPTLPVTPARARGRVATKMVIDPSHAHDLMTAHVGHDWGSTFQMAAIQGRTCVDDTGWWCTTVWKSKFYGAFVLHRRIDLHAIEQASRRDFHTVKHHHPVSSTHVRP